MSNFFILGGAIAQLLLGSPIAPITELPSQPVIVAQRKTTQNWLETARERYQANDYYAAISGFTEAIKIKPTVEALMERSIAWSRVEEHQRALIDINEAIRKAPKLGKLYVIRGFIYMRLNDRKNAVEDMNKGIYLEPTGTAYMSRGLVFIHFNEIDKARMDLNIAAQESKEAMDMRRYNHIMELLGSI